ncbi:MAG: outer membrane lipoprotein carrier protein LolA [Acidobacteria bacterium]|nr:outer membrane lipoprotein carrier protein LolA [Acidobacteriota bacterium]
MKNLLRSSFIAVLAMSFLFVADASAQQGELGKVLRRIEAHNKNLTTMRAGLTWAKENTQLRETDTKTGDIKYAKRPGKDALVRIDWTRPSEIISIGDGKYVLFQPGNKIAYTGSVKNAQKGQTKAASALSFMTMSKAELDSNFDPSYLGQGTLSDGTQVAHLKLMPKGKAGFQWAELWVDVDGMPRQTKIVESNNDVSTFLITKPSKNTPLKKSDFEVSIPSGTDIKKT